MCDDGNNIETDSCRNDCTPARCGDGLIADGLEACDDGNTTTETCAYGERMCTVCSAECQTVPGETSFCGDGRVDEMAGENCDDANDITEVCPDGLNECEVCQAGCVLGPGAPSTCGDGMLDANREECDDGNRITEPCEYGLAECVVCASDCSEVMGATSLCGDGRLDEGHEACDDGNQDNTDECLNTCESPRCGDGHVQRDVEECDDGNTTTEKCAYGEAQCVVCANDCREINGTVRVCGDDVLDEDDEECDDGNRMDGDGCTADCRLEDEPGFPDRVCGAIPMVQPSVYLYDRLPIGGMASTPKAVAFHPSGSYAVIAETHTGIHVYDYVAEQVTGSPFPTLETASIGPTSRLTRLDNMHS